MLRGRLLPVKRWVQPFSAYCNLPILLGFEGPFYYCWFPQIVPFSTVFTLPSFSFTQLYPKRGGRALFRSHTVFTEPVWSIQSLLEASREQSQLYSFIVPLYMILTKRTNSCEAEYNNKCLPLPSVQSKIMSGSKCTWEIEQRSEFGLESSGQEWDCNQGGLSRDELFLWTILSVLFLGIGLSF